MLRHPKVTSEHSLEDYADQPRINANSFSQQHHADTLNETNHANNDHGYLDAKSKSTTHFNTENYRYSNKDYDEDIELYKRHMSRDQTPSSSVMSNNNNKFINGHKVSHNSTPPPSSIVSSDYTNMGNIQQLQSVLQLQQLQYLQYQQSKPDENITQILSNNGFSQNNGPSKYSSATNEIQQDLLEDSSQIITSASTEYGDQQQQEQFQPDIDLSQSKDKSQYNNLHQFQEQLFQQQFQQQQQYQHHHQQQQQQKQQEQQQPQQSQSQSELQTQPSISNSNQQQQQQQVQLQNFLNLMNNAPIPGLTVPAVVPPMYLNQLLQQQQQQQQVHVQQQHQQQNGLNNQHDHNLSMRHYLYSDDQADDSNQNENSNSNTQNISINENLGSMFTTSKNIPQELPKISDANSSIDFSNSTGMGKSNTKKDLQNIDINTLQQIQQLQQLQQMQQLQQFHQIQQLQQMQQFRQFQQFQMQQQAQEQIDPVSLNMGFAYQQPSASMKESSSDGEQKNISKRLNIDDESLNESIRQNDPNRHFIHQYDVKDENSRVALQQSRSDAVTASVLGPEFFNMNNTSSILSSLNTPLLDLSTSASLNPILGTSQISNLPIVSNSFNMSMLPLMNKQMITRRRVVAKSKETSNDPTKPKKYRCAHCTWSFTRHSDLRRHLKSHNKPQYCCPFFNTKFYTCSHKTDGLFNRLDVLKRHLKLVHYTADHPDIFQNKRKKANSTKTESPKENNSKKDSGTCLSCSQHFDDAKMFVLHVPECAENTPMELWRYKRNGDILSVRESEGSNDLKSRENEMLYSSNIENIATSDRQIIEEYSSSMHEDNIPSGDVHTVSVDDLDNKPETISEALRRRRGRPKKNLTITS